MAQMRGWMEKFEAVAGNVSSESGMKKALDIHGGVAWMPDRTFDN